MSEETTSNYAGILRSLKKLIFEDSPEPNPSNPSATETAANTLVVTKHEPIDLTPKNPVLPETDIKQMKIKVIGMLEKINEPGIDFFEVWNAAAEMGNVEPNNIKAAFTSLKYVDKTLDKNKLLTTGRKYADEIKKVIDKETAQKNEQKQNIEQNLIKEKANLTSEIKSIEQNIADLKEKLLNKQQDLKEINNKYEPGLKEIDNKISIGNIAVNEVINDIEKTLKIIETSIN